MNLEHVMYHAGAAAVETLEMNYGLLQEDVEAGHALELQAWKGESNRALLSVSVNPQRIETIELVISLLTKVTECDHTVVVLDSITPTTPTMSDGSPWPMEGGLMLIRKMNLPDAANLVDQLIVIGCDRQGGLEHAGLKYKVDKGHVEWLGVDPLPKEDMEAPLPTMMRMSMMDPVVSDIMTLQGMDKSRFDLTEEEMQGVVIAYLGEIMEYLGHAVNLSQPALDMVKAVAPQLEGAVKPWWPEG